MQRLQRRQRRKRLLRLLALATTFCIIGVIIFAILSFFHKPITQVVESDQISPTTTPFPTPTPATNSDALGQVVQDALQGTHGTYGIVIQNLKTQEYFGLNQTKVFKSGSLYKLWVMATVYQKIQQGKLHLTDTISKNTTDLYKEFYIDTEDQDSAQTITMTIKDALYQMVTISDNDSALLLTDKIGLSSVKSFLQRHGLSGSQVGQGGDQPTTTASDIARFFDMLYNGKLGNTNTTSAMIQLLKQQRLNDKLPQNLPFDVTVAHKTGELDDYSHDAGIIYTDTGDYIIVVLTQSDDTQAAEGRIANISQAVYTYFNP